MKGALNSHHTPAKMALRSLAFCMVMVLVLVLVVALAPGAVEGSSRKLLAQANAAVAAQAYGICNALVTVHGYQCQEITVSIHLFLYVSGISEIVKRNYIMCCYVVAQVTTDDGYILSVQRIGGGGTGKPPVIIQHGVLVVSSLIFRSSFLIFNIVSSVFSDSSAAVGH